MSNAVKETYIATLKDILSQTYPHAHCELNYSNIYELTISVILSAQTTDKAVNLVTPKLFERYPDFEQLAKANLNDVISYIKSIGLYQTKAKNIISLANEVLTRYQGIIPSSLEELITLPGIGRKTANVIVSEGFKMPGLAVDTHVERVSKRLGLVPQEANPMQIELSLKELLDPKDWHNFHHQLLFHGRYHCLARNPKCSTCPLATLCQYHLKTDKNHPE